MPEPMTIEECREYSAVEIIGFKLDPDSDDWWDTSIAGCYGRGMIPKCGWKPDENRNQLNRVLATIPDIYDGVIDSAIHIATATVTKAMGHPNDRLRLIFYQKCMTHPAEALQAICEAHRRHNA